MALSSIGILITCDCANTFTSSTTMDPSVYITDLLDRTSVGVAIGGSSETISVKVNDVNDSVSLTCSVYGITCGDKVLVFS
jgi:hypothetical protein